MAAADTIVLILLVAMLGFGLAWLVGKLADRDKAKRQAAGELPRFPEPAPTLAPGGGPAPVAAGVCPTCRTPYRPDIAFCWACGRDKAS